MSEPEHVHGLVHRYFTRGISREEQAILRAHVRECPTCERVYERYAATEHALGPGTDGVGVATLDRLEGAILDRPPAAPPPTARRWAGALAAVGALAVVFALQPGPSNGLAPRGAAGSTPSGGPSLRVLRIRDDAGQVVVRDLATRTDAPLAPGDKVALLYANHAGATRAQVVLMQGDEAVLVLVPATPVRDGVVDVRLADPLAVTAAWPTGPLTVEARFEGPKGPWRRRVRVRRVDR